MNIILQLFTVQRIFLMVFGTAFGILIGAAPGLSVPFAITVLMATTFHLDSIGGIILLLGAYCGGIYGGSITATLINTPGTASAACTALDGYPLARKGRAGDALKCALVGSTLGGLFSALVLIFLSPQLARVILHIGSPEYFSLCCLGVFAAIGLEGTSFVNIFKGTISAAFGLLLACVGSDPVYGSNRLMFGNYRMASGIQVITMMLGVYAVAQIMMNGSSIVRHGEESLKIEHVGKASLRFLDILKHWKTLLKSAIIGTFIGAVPRTGGATAAMMAYNEARRSSKHPEEFGSGSVEAIIAAETANNAVSGGAMIPMLTLAIPGDSAMAILLGALSMVGVAPGAKLFIDGDPWVYIIMCSLIVINLIMLLEGTLCVNLFAQVARIPQTIMVPCILIMCTIGAFAINNNSFELYIMVLFGLIGYIMRQFQLPITPLSISLVLGPLFEKNLRRSLVLSNGSWLTFLQRPISCAVLILALILLFYPMITQGILRLSVKCGGAAPALEQDAAREAARKAEELDR